MCKANNNMVDNKQGVIELNGDDEENESDEEQELNREHGSKKEFTATGKCY